jgi:hypothetical protein
VIAKEIEVLRDLLKGLEKAKSNERIMKSLNERQVELMELRDATRTAFDSFAAINKRAVIAQRPDGEKALKYIRDVQETLKSADPEGITKGRIFTTMRNAITKLASEIDVTTIEAWKDFVVKFQPKLDPNQVEQARRLPGHKDDVLQLESLDSKSKKLSGKPPQDDEAFAALESLWATIRSLVISLPSPSDNPEIQAFLEAANSREGAPIDLMTEEVMDWLKKQKMSKKFRIHQA